MEHTMVIGVLGLLLVFTSFIVRNWVWLYSFNLSGAVLLTIYAYMIGDPIFTIVEAGISAFLSYRLVSEIRSRRARPPGAKV